MCGQLVLYINYNCIFQHLIVCSQLFSYYTCMYHYHWQPSEVLKRRFFDEISSNMTEAITNQHWAVSIHKIHPITPTTTSSDSPCSQRRVDDKTLHNQFGLLTWQQNRYSSVFESFWNILIHVACSWSSFAHLRT